MSQLDVVSAAKATFVQAQAAAQDQALTDFGNACYSGGKSEAGGGTFTQADIDAAVAAQTAADKVSLDALAAKEGIEADQLAKIKAVLGA